MMNIPLKISFDLKLLIIMKKRLSCRVFNLKITCDPWLYLKYIFESLYVDADL